MGWVIEVFSLVAAGGEAAVLTMTEVFIVESGCLQGAHYANLMLLTYFTSTYRGM